MAGNSAALGNRGGGRPPRVYRSLIEEFSARSLFELYRVATDSAHPWHEKHGFQALRDLVRLTTPKLEKAPKFDGDDPSAILMPQPSIEEMFQGK